MNRYDRNLDLFDKRIRGISKELIAEQQNGSQGMMEGLTSHDLVENSDCSDNGVEKTFLNYWIGLLRAEVDPCLSIKVRCYQLCFFFGGGDLKPFQEYFRVVLP